MRERVKVARFGDLLDEVSKRLAFNVSAYGKVWTGEDEDTAFVCAPLVEALAEKDAEIARLRAALEQIRDLPSSRDLLFNAKAEALWCIASCALDGDSDA